MSLHPDVGSVAAQQGLPWRKPRRSINAGNCVEATVDSNGVIIRDSANRAAVTIRYSRQAWLIFLDRARNGNFDVTAV
jgi:hypothetical protein